MGVGLGLEQFLSRVRVRVEGLQGVTLGLHGGRGRVRFSVQKSSIGLG